MGRHTKPLANECKAIMDKMYSHDRVHSSATLDKRFGDAGRLGQMIEQKYGLESINNLKPGHIQGVFADMKDGGMSQSQLTSYATAARVITKGIGKENIVSPDNKSLGISRAGERYKPIEANLEKLEQIKNNLYKEDKWLGLAAEMREQFGLRVRESLGSINTVQHPDGKLELEVRWAKGGRHRTVPIETPDQRDIIQRVQQYVRENGLTSLIPKNFDKAEGIKYQKEKLDKLGAHKSTNSNAHALRHHYAQEQIEAGAFRMDVAEKLGHGREEVVSHYVQR